MASIKIGRNEACPCGSGKKYKKCCLGKNIDLKATNFENICHFLPSDEEIDYKDPILSDAFFETNKVHEISAPRLLYSCLLYPEIESMVSTVSNAIIDRGKEERAIIISTEDIRALLDVMDRKPDPLNHRILMKKISSKKEISIPLILEELKQPKSEAFVELSVRIIHASGIDCSDQIIDLITKHHRGAYAISLLCMLLGFYENTKSEKVLWNYYYFFKEHFPGEPYSDGPLLGLIEIRARRKDKSIIN